MPNIEIVRSRPIQITITQETGSCGSVTFQSGKTIKAGDKVVMWYVSGNRDEAFFERPDEYDIERDNVCKHLSFGFGIHRCMGNRLAELQVQILWEELLKRFDRVEVVGKETRNESVFVRGYTSLPVKLHPRAA